MSENDSKRTVHVDLFVDNIYNINKLEDIKETETINLLEKNGNCISFELGGDFFKCDMENDNIIQYSDFVSLRDEKQNYNLAEISKNIPDNHEKLLYLTTIKESIKSNEIISNLKDYALKNRDNYIKKDLKNTLPINTNFNLNRKNIESIIKISSVLLKSAGISELINLTELTELALTTVSIFSMFYKNFAIEKSKNNIVNNIIANYSGKNHKFILNNEEIKAKFPDLDNILRKLEEFNVQLNINNGIKDNTEKIVSEILNDSNVMLFINKLSETDIFQNYLKKNNENFINIKNKTISELNPKLVNELLSNKERHLKEIIHEINKPFEKSRFIKVFSDLKLSPSEDNKNFCISNEIINDLLKENNRKEDNISINSMLSSMNLEKINSKKLIDIIENISKNILGIEINNVLNLRKL